MNIPSDIQRGDVYNLGWGSQAYSQDIWPFLTWGEEWIMVIPISYDLLIPQDLPWYGHGSKHTKTYLRFRVGYLDGFENMILFIPVFRGRRVVSYYRFTGPKLFLE